MRPQRRAFMDHHPLAQQEGALHEGVEQRLRLVGVVLQGPLGLGRRGVADQDVDGSKGLGDLVHEPQ